MLSSYDDTSTFEQDNDMYSWMNDISDGRFDSGIYSNVNTSHFASDCNGNRHSSDLPAPGICQCGGEYIDSSDGFKCNICDTIAPYSVDEYISMVQKKKEGLNHQQRKLLHERLKILNDSAKNRGVDPVSDIILDTTLDYFANLREVTEETRSQKMMSRIGACLYFACIKHGSAKSTQEISRFCMINGNINKAIELITTMEKGSKKIVGLDKIDDHRRSHICGILSKIRNIKPDVKDLQNDDIKSKIADLAIYTFDTAEENLIRISSKYNTKIAACTYIGLRLALPDYKPPITLDDVSHASGIHLPTISNYVEGIKMNISLFPSLTQK